MKRQAAAETKPVRSGQAYERPRMTKERLDAIDRSLSSSGLIAELVREIKMCWLDIRQLRKAS